MTKDEAIALARNLASARTLMVVYLDRDGSGDYKVTTRTSAEIMRLKSTRIVYVTNGN